MKLVLLHGRAQEDKDPHELRDRWVSALRRGIEGIGHTLPIDERDIVFPYYGDALRDATSDDPDTLAMVRYPLREHVEDDLGCAVLHECLHGAGLTEAIVDELAPRDPSLDPRLVASLSNEWVQRGLSLLDRHVPGMSARSLAMTANDVAVYLENPAVRDHIEAGVAHAFDSCGTEPTVVVGHSFGSILAYRMLRAGGRITCPVRALITLGSPLGIGAVRRALDPIGHPPLVARWSNAYDDRDVVALHPLDHEYFAVSPRIRNHGGVRNPSDNHHRIDGYLHDPIVAGWIVAALESD